MDASARLQELDTQYNTLFLEEQRLRSRLQDVLQQKLRLQGAYTEVKRFLPEAEQAAVPDLPENPVTAGERPAEETPTDESAKE